ncbi:MAG: TIGR02099 family protein [Betaproteobacteria bacterium]|nr:TIGR02099 family protein [Betaproteobacteria bacterium]
MARWLIPLHWSWRVAFRVVAPLYFALAIGIVGLRYWLLPMVPEFKGDIERVVSRSLGEPVTIGAIVAGWSRFHPTLDITDLALRDKAGNVALSFASVAVEVSWRSLLVWDLRFHSIVLDRPALRVQRARNGVLSVAGIEIPPDIDSTSSHAVTDWLLRQGELVISGGTIEWIDEQRGAPPLLLSDVAFRFVNDITGLHRVALKATPPAHLAADLDVRGQFRGDSFADLNQFTGEMFAQLQYADLAGWKQWVDYPFALNTGRGAIRIWSTVEDGKMTEATADVALADVKMQLLADLPVLSLMSIEGRLGARETGKGRGFLGLSTGQSSGYRIFAERFAISLTPQIRHDAASFSLQWDRPTAAGAPDRGEFRAASLQLAPIVEIAEKLPLPAAIRRVLVNHQPQGTISDAAITWTGDADAPLTYQARARFAGVGFEESGKLPGLKGLAGNFEATQRGGHATISGDHVRLAYPYALRWTDAVDFDAVTVQANWSMPNKPGAPQFELKIPAIRLVNREATIVGSVAWHALPDSPGYIDLDLRIPNAEPRAIYKYIPGLDPKTATWLKDAFLAGNATDGRVRIKGEVFHFPFREDQHGIFQVSAKASAMTLKVAPDFPPFQGVHGDVAIRGTSLDVQAQRGRMYGVEIGATHVRSPDLDNGDPELLVNSTAMGSTPDFLRYIAESPLSTTIGAAIGAATAQGRGRLGLALKIPLRRIDQIDARGTFELMGNQLVMAADAAPINKLAGKLEFQDRAISATGLTAEYLGGPVRIDLSARDGSLRVAAQGSVGIDAVKRAYSVPLGEYLSGAARYSAQLNVTRSTFDLSIDSTLQGAQIALPAPFGKTPEASMAFKLERNIVESPGGKGPQLRNHMQVSLGPLVKGLAQFRPEQKEVILDRAVLTLGDVAAVLPDRSFLSVSGNLGTLDLDQLMPVLQKLGAAGPAAANQLSTGPITMRVAELLVAGRRIHNAQFRVDLVPDGWAASIQARELAGDLRWLNERDGRMIARFKHFDLPESVTPEGAPETVIVRELPGLDIFVESFAAYGKQFGRLELTAINEKTGWRVHQATLSAPEGTINAKGLWQPPDRGDRTELDVVAEVSDVGGYLARIGQPGAVSGAQAKLTGQFGWSGPPTRIHYPTLTGNLTLKAESGRFLKAEPGIARLLGVLSLQSLPRRLTLDFRDVFSDGFSFDEINAIASIERGIMSTSEFRMVGPSAGVGIAGSVDLDNETQTLKVRVVPIIGDSVAAVAGLALLNPLVGLGTFIAQRLLRDPIGRLLAHEYAVTGSWGDPKVERISLFRAPNSATDTPVGQ